MKIRWNVMFDRWAVAVIWWENISAAVTALSSEDIFGLIYGLWKKVRACRHLDFTHTGTNRSWWAADHLLHAGTDSLLWHGMKWEAWNKCARFNVTTVLKLGDLVHLMCLRAVLVAIRRHQSLPSFAALIVVKSFPSDTWQCTISTPEIHSLHLIAKSHMSHLENWNSTVLEPRHLYLNELFTVMENPARARKTWDGSANSAVWTRAVFLSWACAELIYSFIIWVA